MEIIEQMTLIIEKNNEYKLKLKFNFNFIGIKQITKIFIQKIVFFSNCYLYLLITTKYEIINFSQDLIKNKIPKI